jgi:hypothetical protein
MARALLENSHDLIVDAETTQAIGPAEREAALKMSKSRLKAQSTLDAGKSYDVKEFVGALQARDI